MFALGDELCYKTAHFMASLVLIAMTMEMGR